MLDHAGERLMITSLSRTYWSCVTILGLAAVLVGAQACKSAASTSPVNKDSAGVAVKGYDVVAYFKENKPVKGNKEFQYEWMGAGWQFSSAANRDLFAANPGKYAPQYGGYCAFGVSEGHKAPVDPNVWKVVDGKLYLNYDESLVKEWRKDIPGRIAKADKNWMKVRNK